MIRKTLTAFIGLYLGWGLLGGMIFAWAIPAMNWKGVLYYAFTWPVYYTQAGDSFLPMWVVRHLYTFD